MSLYQIKCDDMDEFIAVCSELVMKGICFEAEAGTFTIRCTGGY